MTGILENIFELPGWRVTQQDPHRPNRESLPPIHPDQLRLGPKDDWARTACHLFAMLEKLPESHLTTFIMKALKLDATISVKYQTGFTPANVHFVM